MSQRQFFLHSSRMADFRPLQHVSGPKQAFHRRVDEDEAIGSTQPMRKRDGIGAVIPCGGGNCTDPGQCPDGAEQGECTQGEQVCYGVYPDGGPIWVCQGDTSPSPEECDGLDNDCDGYTESDTRKEVSRLCGGCDTEPQCTGNPDQGECSQGIEYCNIGTWMGCNGAAEPLDELCDGRDNDCDGLVDDDVNPSTDPRLGDECGYGEGDCVAGTTICADGGVVCSGGEPSGNPEICGRNPSGSGDEDCDGRIDEESDMSGAFADCGGCDVPGECPGGTSGGTCLPGQMRCVGGPDIDGKNMQCCRGVAVDQDTGAIICIEDVPPQEEVCDGLDNDCDGLTDETAADPGPNSSFVSGTGTACGTDEGDCTAGQIMCLDIEPGAGQVFGLGCCAVRGGNLECATPIVESSEEVCGSPGTTGDEDCDGYTDEDPDNPLVPMSFECEGCDDEPQCTSNPNEGECQVGTNTCTAGAWTGCQDYTNPSSELDVPCDGKDNDCDGLVDEDDAVGLEQAMRQRDGNGDIIPCGGCDTEAQCTGDPAAGECEQGESVCYGVYPDDSPIWVCEGAVEPQIELCDGLDNDCDGNTESAAGGEVSRLCGGCDTEPQCTGDPNEGECSEGIEYCENGTWQSTCTGEQNPGDELCDGLDNDCDGLVDNDVNPSTDPRLGSACGNGEGDCVAGTTICADGGIECQGGEGSSNPEICGRDPEGSGDEDCDGVIDEENDMTGVFASCGGCTNPTECPNGTDEGICVSGETRCTGGPGIDDKAIECCRGTIEHDGGLIECIPDIGPAAEVCDGKDNDCDGLTDEWDGNAGDNASFVPGTGAACNTDEGECTAGISMCVDLGSEIFGITCCASRASDLSCETPVVMAESEMLDPCNNEDDDCDGDTDEGPASPGSHPSYVETDPCGTTCASIGTCPAGTDANSNGYLDYCEGARTCTTGSWSGCEYGPGSHGVETEECDLLDNDCNGTVDDGLTNILCGTTCASIGGCVGSQDISPANGYLDYCEGVQTCNSGSWSSCDAPTPEPEGNYTCDTLDNDCDGYTDEVFYSEDSVFNCGSDCGDIENCNTDFQDGNADCTSGAYTRTCIVDCVSGNCTITGCRVGYADTDGSAPWSCTCKLSNNGVEICDGEDNDCDGTVDNPEVFAGIPEVCDGVDNDCDGAIDAADTGSQAGNIGGGMNSLEPTSLCKTIGACTGTTLTCTAGTWTCNYSCTPPMYCSGGVPVADETGHCDGFDNDCDGSTDEDFYEDPYFLGMSCSTCDIAGYSGECAGACYAEGTWYCDSDDPSITRCCDSEPCNAANELERPSSPDAAEVCDGVDNDCDGMTDEDLVPGEDSNLETMTVNIGGTDIEIFRYEASKGIYADTTGTACSTMDLDAGIEPWVNVDWNNARAACCQLNRSDGNNCNGTDCCTGAVDEWDLCVADDWEYVCMNGSSVSTPYPYGSTYDGGVCNGHDLYRYGDAGPEDYLLACGHPDIAGCYADYSSPDLVYDQSGNAEEWTLTPVHMSLARGYQIRGGSFNDLFESLACDYDLWAAGVDLTMPNLGFRCCRGKSDQGLCDQVLYDLEENFDGETSSWSTGALLESGCSGTSSWEIGEISYPLDFFAFSEPNVLATDLYDNYDQAECSYVQSPVVDLTTCASDTVRMYFLMRRRINSTYAGLIVEASSDGGSSWTKIDSAFVSAAYNATISTVDGMNGTDAWSKDRSNWMKYTVTIPGAYLGPDFSIRFRFESHDTQATEEGVYIDNVYFARD